MNSIMKKILFVIVFVLITLVLPAIILLMFVDAATNFSAYVITYGVIIFAVFGYVVASVRNMEKKLEDALEEIKMQNAAIAYKLANSNFELDNVPQQSVAPVVEAPVVEEPIVNNTANVPLNPAEPLVMPTEKKAEKTADDGFDDFK